MMSQFILNIDEPQLETALNEMAQKDGKNITDVIVGALQYFISVKPSPPATKIDKELQAKLDAILKSGDETEYVRQYPILSEQVEKGIEYYKQSNWFVPTPEQLGLDK
jgi:hypothetical protein